MATSLLEMSSFGEYIPQQPDFEFRYDSHMASPYGTQDAPQEWQSLSHDTDTKPNTSTQMYNAQHYSFPSVDSAGTHPDLAGQPQFQPQLEVTSDDSSPVDMSTTPVTSNFSTRVMNISPTSMFPSHAWEQTHSVNIKQPCLELHGPSPLRRDSFYNENLATTLEHAQMPASPASSKHSTPLGSPPTLTRKVRPQRRRRTENAEPGSERAIYLAKNRQAAMKCRNKQRRQQEELVEFARDAERRNKALKAEAEALQVGLRELMEILCRHTECPDTRIRQYVQRGADRIVDRGG